MRDRNTMGKNVYSFESFIPGNNVFTYQIAKSMVSQVGRYNPFFLYGPSGVGKTHLSQSIFWEFSEKYPDKKIVSWTSEAYTNAFIQTLRSGDHSSLLEFKRKNRNSDLFIMEDFHFFAGGQKDATLQELFQCFDALYMAQKQIIITSAITLRELNLLPRYTSRLSMGLVCQLQPYDFPSRKEILLVKCKEEGISLNTELFDYIASNITDIRALIGVVNKLVVQKELNPHFSDMTIQEMEKLLQDIIRPKKAQLSPEKILSIVCDYYNLSMDEIRSSKKKKEILLARQISIYLCRTLIPDLSFKQLGKIMNKDHTSILYSINKVQTKLNTKDGAGLKNTIDHFMREALKED